MKLFSIFAAVFAMTNVNAYQLDSQTEVVIFDNLCGVDAVNFAVWTENSRPYYKKDDPIPSVESDPKFSGTRRPSPTGQKTCFYPSECSKDEEGANVAAWEWLQRKYGDGSITACSTFHDKLKTMINGLSTGGQLASDPDKFRDVVVAKLHEGGCSIDAYDDNVEAFVEALNLLFQQRARMDAAKQQAQNYRTKLELTQGEWGDLRTKFETEMNKHANTINNFLKSSETKAAQNELRDATEDLMGTVSARSETHIMEETIRDHMKSFENLAYKLKRDAIRWSQLHQITNEKERAQYFVENVKAKAYAILNTCMVNYQMEWGI